MSSPHISVALPVYNGAEYIATAIRSILAQCEDVEIIVSDDCSSDDTVEIVRSFCAPQIKLIVNEQNGGQFVNFNRAVRAASGRYIQLFSHDDYARLGFLRSQIEAFERHPDVGLVYASCNIIDEIARLIRVCDDDGTPEIIDFNTYLRIASHFGNLPPSVSCVMVERRVLDSIGLFDERYFVAGDIEFYNRIAERFLLARNRKLLLDVRVHSGSVTSGSATPIRYMQEEVELLGFYRRHLGESGYQEMIKRRAHSRGADHAKYILRALLRGEIKNCIVAYRALSRVHYVPLCVAIAIRQKNAKMFGFKGRRE